MPTINYVCQNPVNRAHKKHLTKKDVCEVPDNLLEDCRKYCPEIALDREKKICFNCRLELQRKIVKKIANQPLPTATVAMPDTTPKGILGRLTRMSAKRTNTDTKSSVLADSEPSTSLAANTERNKGECATTTLSSPLTAAAGNAELDELEELELISNDENVSPVRLLSASSSAESSPAKILSDDENVERAITDANVQLEMLDMSPFTAVSVRTKKTVVGKIRRAVSSFKEKLERATNSPEVAAHCQDCETFSAALYVRFQQSESRLDKYRILSCTPASWRVIDMQNKMKCTEWQARIAYELKLRFGGYSLPISNITKAKISEETVATIKSFYLSADNSRDCPGQRETITIIDGNGSRVRVSKKRILVSLRELHAEYMKMHGRNNPVSISKFSLLRPKQCVWPGSKGHHNTCTCEKHENFKLLQEASGNRLKTSEFLELVLCPDPSPNCYLRYCEKCPNLEKIENHLKKVEDEEYIEFYQWVKTDRSEMVKITETFLEYQIRFLAYVNVISPHHFLATTQQEFIQNLITSKIKNETSMVLQVDFGQNYSFVVQNSVQGFHWNNRQATIHPFVAHWFNAEKKQYKTYFVISDDLTHDANTFHYFRRNVVNQIIQEFGNSINKIYYVSDGPGSQYKNQYNVFNLAKHFNEFKIEAEWIYTATSHGKSMCDGLSGVVKRLVRLHSMKEGVRITSPKEMYDYCQSNLKTDKLNFMYAEQGAIKEYWSANANRYDTCKPIPGIRKIHSVRPVSENHLQLKEYSSCPVWKNFYYVRHDAAEYIQGPKVSIQIGMYIAAIVNRNFQIGLVIQMHDESGELVLQMMKKHTKPNNFLWPENELREIITRDEVLMTISPPCTPTGRIYNMEKKEFANLEKQFAAYQKTEKQMVLK